MMKFSSLKFFFRKLLEFRAFRKVEVKSKDNGAVEVAKKAVGVGEIIVKRVSIHAHLLEQILHFHLVGFGLVTGLTLMTVIVALGNLGIAMEFFFLNENKNLIHKFAYISFFIPIFMGFLKHYKSEHHKRSVEVKKKVLDADYLQKRLILENEYEIMKNNLENEFKNREIYLKQRQKKLEGELEVLRKKVQKADNEKKPVWDKVGALNPVGVLWKNKQDHKD